MSKGFLIKYKRKKHEDNINGVIRKLFKGNLKNDGNLATREKIKKRCGTSRNNYDIRFHYAIPRVRPSDKRLGKTSEIRVPRIGDYASCMKLRGLNSVFSDMFHSDFHLKCLGENSTYWQILEACILNLIKSNMVGGFELDKMLKLALIFGVEKHNLIQRAADVKAEFKVNIESANQSSTYTISNHFTEYFKCELRSWGQHVVNEFSRTTRLRKKLSLDEFVRMFESETMCFSKKKFKKSIKNFNKIVDKCGGNIKLLNPIYFF